MARAGLGSECYLDISYVVLKPGRVIPGPARAYCDVPATVVLEVAVLGISATVVHLEPDVVQWVLVETVLGLGLGGALLSVAPAARCVSGAQVQTENYRLGAAVAPAQPGGFALLVATGSG